jgi:hypothetical protein
MALRAAKGDENALGGRGARAHACRLDTRVEAWLLRLTNRVFNAAARSRPETLRSHRQPCTLEGPQRGQGRARCG